MTDNIEYDMLFIELKAHIQVIINKANKVGTDESIDDSDKHRERIAHHSVKVLSKLSLIEKQFFENETFIRTIETFLKEYHSNKTNKK